MLDVSSTSAPAQAQAQPPPIPTVGAATGGAPSSSSEPSPREILERLRNALQNAMKFHGPKQLESIIDALLLLQLLGQPDGANVALHMLGNDGCDCTSARSAALKAASGDRVTHDCDPTKPRSVTTSRLIENVLTGAMKHHAAMKANMVVEVERGTTKALQKLVGDLALLLGSVATLCDYLKVGTTRNEGGGCTIVVDNAVESLLEKIASIAKDIQTAQIEDEKSVLSQFQVGSRVHDQASHDAVHRADINALRVKILEEQKKAADLESKLNDTMSNLRMAQSQLKIMKDAHDVVTNQMMTDRDTAVQLLEMKLDLATAKTANLTATLASAATETNFYRESLEKTRTAMTEAETRNSAAVRNATNLRVEHEKRIAGLENELSTLRSELSTLRSEHDKCAAVRAEVAGLQSMIHRLTDQNERQRRRMDPTRQRDTTRTPKSNRTHDTTTASSGADFGATGDDAASSGTGFGFGSIQLPEPTLPSSFQHPV